MRVLKTSAKERLVLEREMLHDDIVRDSQILHNADAGRRLPPGLNRAILDMIRRRLVFFKNYYTELSAKLGRALPEPARGSGPVSGHTSSPTRLRIPRRRK